MVWMLSRVVIGVRIFSDSYVNIKILIGDGKTILKLLKGYNVVLME